MYRQGVGDFKYYVGISSLAQIATRQDRVCVLNILGGESSDVTPVGHEYSGGNVVFGTSPGRGGQTLETKIGNVPVYNNVREGLLDGHRFNCGVIYLPPSAARDGVARSRHYQTNAATGGWPNPIRPTFQPGDRQPRV